MKFHSIFKRLQAVLKNPIEELSRGERLLVYVWQLVKQGAKQLSKDRASMMAASLTYRTLFGMLPVTVVGAGVAKAIMGNERFELFLHNAIAALGMNQVQLDGAENAEAITLGSWLSDIVSTGMNINVAALTWIGLLILVYSAITLLVDIEQSFNSICHLNRGRSWLHRIPLYWFVLTFGPVLMAVAFWADTVAGGLIESTLPWNWLSWTLTRVWDFFLGWLCLLFLYRYVPTVKLRLNALMAGAFVAALLLLVGKESLGLYFNHALSLQHMYGSLGLVPVFMFWLYLMWLIVLLGLQISAIVQQVSSAPK
ncbi:MAG: YihY family inner membrane protein [Planctomycetes bacterium]|nr:YihY family inner membrane protein [Planctomycetota bacterium]